MRLRRVTSRESTAGFQMRSVSCICTHLSTVYVTYTIDREKPESGKAGLFREMVEIRRTLPPVHPLLEWNYVARPLCDIVDKVEKIFKFIFDQVCILIIGYIFLLRINASKEKT